VALRPSYVEPSSAASMSGAPWWFQAVTLGLNTAQTVALAYIYTRWRRLNGSGTPAGGWKPPEPPKHYHE
jgi:hypothetical protein